MDAQKLYNSWMANGLESIASLFVPPTSPNELVLLDAEVTDILQSKSSVEIHFKKNEQFYKIICNDEIPMGTPKSNGKNSTIVIRNKEGDGSELILTIENGAQATIRFWSGKIANDSTNQDAIIK